MRSTSERSNHDATLSSHWVLVDWARDRISALPIEPGKLVVELALQLRVKRVAVQRPRPRYLFRLLAPAAPAPREQTDHAGRADDPDERQHPSEQVPAVPGRRREDARAPDVDLLVDDLAPRPALADPLLDVRLDPLGRRRVGLRQRLAGTDRAHELVLELRERRVPLARDRRGGERERGHGEEEDPHAFCALSIPARSVASLICPATWPTTRPRGSTKKVSGRPVSPYGGEVTFLVS